MRQFIPNEPGVQFHPPNGVYLRIGSLDELASVGGKGWPHDAVEHMAAHVANQFRLGEQQDFQTLSEGLERMPEVGL